MNTYNRFDRGQDKPFTHEFFDPAEAGWQADSHESASEYLGTGPLENQTDELSLGKERSADIEVGASENHADSVFASVISSVMTTLSTLRPVPFL